jgi:oligopeptide transport system ATP-binding protein
VTAPLLEVRGLVTEFTTEEGIVQAVNGVSFQIHPREVLAIVGESGSGKTVTALSILDLVPKPHGRIIAGEVLFKGRDLRKMSREEMRKIRGNRIAMVFQDPLTALNPVFSVGKQIAEVFRTHQGLGRNEAWGRAVGLLDLVGIPRARERASDFPHQFSGGMRQRAMIAMAVSMNPDILIADEPTTALDVTVQAQILDLLTSLQQEFEMGLMLITHNLGMVAEHAHNVGVMYAGRIAEYTKVEEVYYRPQHPYTIGLMNSVARLDRERQDRLKPISGSPPSLINIPSGCPFHPRCPYAREICREEYPALIARTTDVNHLAACHFAGDLPDPFMPRETV